MSPAVETLLKEEKNSESPTHRWRPKNLLSPFFVADLLSTAYRKWKLVGQALPELASSGLPQVSDLVVAHHRMGLRLKQASIYKDSDHNLFFRAVSSFYVDYNVVMEALYRGVLQGLLAQPPSPRH